jgi:hypothetical protein
LKSESTRRVLRKAKKRPTNDQELWEWLRDVLGLRYARTVTTEGHRPLFEFVADVFFGRENKVLIRSCRGSGKTISYAALCLLNTVFKEDFDIVYIGGSEQQSKQGYAYYAGDPEKEGFVGFIRRDSFKDMLAGEPMVSKTALKNGSRVEIRTGGSDKSVSGPHPVTLLVDELDHIQMSTLNTALQMPISRGPYPSQTVMASSQYASFGTLQTLLDEAPSRGIKVYECDLFDIMQPCGRSYPRQCQDCPLYEWHNPYTGKKEELCKGRGAKSDGHYAYKDACDKILITTDLETFALQMLLLRGTSQGLVYNTFNKDTHVRAFPPSGVDLSKWKCWAGIDLRTHGRIEVMAEAPEILKNGKKLRWVIDEWTDDQSTPSTIRKAAFEMREDVRARWGLELDVFWMEPSAADEATDWQKTGLNGRITPKEVRNVIYGIKQVRDALLDVDGNASLFFDPRCARLIEEVGKKYRCVQKPDGAFDRDRPEKKFDHASDSMRYAYVGGSVVESEHLIDQPTRAGWWDTAGGGRSKWSPY